MPGGTLRALAARLRGGPRLVLHVGYPKTATSTLQLHCWPHHPQVEYLGKFLPHHGYRDAGLGELVNALMVAFDADWQPGPLRAALDAARRACTRPVMLLSSENFVHPWSHDPGVVARRLAQVAPGARILLVLREQVSLLQSFHRRPGAYGQYLYLNKYTDEPLALPLPSAAWMDYQFRFPSKNLLGYLDFDAVARGYEQAFGADRLTILTYEQLQRDPAGYAAALAAALGIAALPEAERLGELRENAGPDSRTARETGDFHDPIPSEWAERVRARFRAGNAALAARHGLGLAALGYAC